VRDGGRLSDVAAIPGLHDASGQHASGHARHRARPVQPVHPGRDRDERALAILFEGRAPFATIAAEGLFAHFECELRDAANKAVSITDTGYAYFDGAATELDPSSGLMLLSYPNGHQERLKYRAVVFLGLKARTAINGPNDVDLLQSGYDHIACQARGASMAPVFIASNELVVARQDVVALAAAHP
jgi:hypothetical protein